MTQSWGYAAQQVKAPLEHFQFTRRDPGAKDVVIDIQYCGVCHSDLHQVNDDWGGSMYPMVPGHEIVGKVVHAGADVTKFKAGDTVGVGVFVDSCRTCEQCKTGLEQYCENGFTGTYNARDKNGDIVFGGYSNNIVMDESYVLKVSPELNLAAVAPLLCAGITTYSPLRHWNVGPGKKVGIIGLGGLGHMGLKFAHAFGAHVVQFTTSLSKKDDALKLGADEVVLSTDPDAMAAQAGTFDVLLNTVSAPHDVNNFLSLLKLDGTMVLVGLPEQPPVVQSFSLLTNRRSIAGSMIGGIAETQEMLDFCAEKGITAEIELIPIQQIQKAYERMVKNDVKYRFVIDLATLPKP
ncbi:MAG: NAD(P)-dependent alcohol dehydrogenase [Acidobacteriaceae bacterium]